MNHKEFDMSIEHGWKPCPDCEGHGYMPTKGVPMHLWPPCERCEGKSEVPADPAEEAAWRAAPGGITTDVPSRADLEHARSARARRRRADTLALIAAGPDDGRYSPMGREML